MPIGNNDYWTPGQSGNPSGRRKGTKNKVTRELFEEAERRGYKQPVLYLLEVMHDESAEPELRVTCATAAAPYMTPKFGTIVPPRFIEDEFEVPDFLSIEQAEDYLKQIPVLLGRGEIDSALELSTLVRNWILSIHARSELELKKISVDGPGEQTIHITGGLPPLPGTNVTMPVLDGRQATNGHALEPPSPAVPQIGSQGPGPWTSSTGA
jgi:hypothetical protein